MPDTARYRIQQPTSHPNISFTALTWDDMPELEHVNQSLFPVRYTSQFYQRLFDEDVFNVLARDTHNNNELVGVVSARVVPNDNCFSTHRGAYLMTLGVVDSHRRTRLGTALLQEILRLVSSEGRCNELRLHVLTTNHAALSFYKRNNFDTLDTIVDYYFFHDQHHNAHVLSRDLGVPPSSSNGTQVGDRILSSTWGRVHGTLSWLSTSICGNGVQDFHL